MQIPKNRHISNQFSTGAQQRVNQNSTLCVDFSELTVIVCSIQKLSYRGIARPFRLEPFLNSNPLFNRIKSSALAGDAGHVEFGSVMLFDITTIGGRQFDTPLLVHTAVEAPSANS